MSNGVIPAAVAVVLLTVILILAYTMGGGKPKSADMAAAPIGTSNPGLDNNFNSDFGPTIGSGPGLSGPATDPTHSNTPPSFDALPPLNPTLPPLTGGFDGGVGAGSNPVAPMVPPAPVESTGDIPATHTVASGEMLSDISQTYYGTTKMWKAIQALNPDIDPNAMQPGHVLKLPPKPAPVATNATTGVDDPNAYVVKSGDTYQEISKSVFGTTRRWKDIQELNSIAPGDLRPGQKLKLPAKSDSAVPPAGDSTAVQPVVAPPGGKTHKIERDEYLQDIARKEYGSARYWPLIVAANPGVNPNRLKPGTVIVIPPKSETGKPSTAGGGNSGGGSAVERPTAGSGEYIVKSGDTGAEIAKTTLGKGSRWSEIVAVNPGLDAQHLKIGQKIVIPGGGPASPLPADQTTPRPLLGTGGTSGTSGTSGTGGTNTPTRPVAPPKDYRDEFFDFSGAAAPATPRTPAVGVPPAPGAIEPAPLRDRDFSL